LQLAQLLIQRAQPLHREARADAADIAKLSLLVVCAQEQRTEPDTGVARIRETADDELALLHALDLEPIGRSPAAIVRRPALRHDPFEAELTNLVEQRLALA